MAPASASSPPPSEQPDAGRHPERRQEKETREKHEIYGPLDIRKQTKDDGRGLIIYALRRGRERV